MAIFPWRCIISVYQSNLSLKAALSGKKKRKDPMSKYSHLEDSMGGQEKRVLGSRKEQSASFQAVTSLCLTDG